MSTRRDKRERISHRQPKQQLRQEIGRRRLWAFRVIVLVASPVLTLLLLEAGLRLVGYGFPAAATIPCRIDGVASYSDNFRFAWRFFPPQIARTANSFAFAASKPESTYRIFVLGESAAAGTPDGAFSFGRVLQVMLHRSYPQTNFEVITVAMPAINSYAVREIAADCVRHQSDLLVVYLGNNEAVGPYGPGTVFTPFSPSLSLIRLGITLKAAKLGQLMTNLLAAAGAGNGPQVWGGMEMFLAKQVPADDRRLQTVYRHFQRNLEDIRDLACKSGTKVVFCTVASNLRDNPPFASLHRPGLTDAEKKNWDGLYRQGIASETEGNYGQAVQKYLAAAQIDDHFADASFRLARCYWAMGEYDLARERYVQARELDTLRFRADDRINEIIRNAAAGQAAQGVYLVDAVKTFQENSPHETAGQELFYEHVHLNFHGNYLLARTLFEQVAKILPQRIEQGRESDAPVLSEAECARYLAYTDWDRYKIADEVLNQYVKQPPFTNQLYHAQRVSQMERDLRALKASLSQAVLKETDAQYRWASRQNPSDWWLHWKYGGFLEERGSLAAAAEQFRLVLKYVPQRYEAHAKLGLLSGEQGDLETAVAGNREAIRMNPLYADAWYNMGLAYYLQNKLAPSIECYSKAIRFKRDYAKAYSNLGVALYQQGKADEAAQTYRKGLAIVPNDLDLHYNLGLLLDTQGHRDEALRELRKALEIDPNSAKTRQALGARAK